MAFYHMYEVELSSRERDTLVKLGFRTRLTLEAENSIPKWTPPKDLDPSLAPPAGQARAYNRQIVECACGPDSRLGRETAWSHRCHVIRITEKEDLRSAGGVLTGLAGIRNDLPTLAVGSLPCTAESPWQRINALKGEATQTAIREKREQWQLMMDGFEMIARENHARGVYSFRDPFRLGVLEGPQSSLPLRIAPANPCISSRLHVQPQVATWEDGGDGYQKAVDHRDQLSVPTAPPP